MERGSYKSSFLGYRKYDKMYLQAEKEAQAMFPEFETNNEQALERIWTEYVDIRNRLLAEKMVMTYRKVLPE